WCRRGWGPAASAAVVRVPVPRSARVGDSCGSSRAMWVDTFDCTVCRARAAAEKLPWSATATMALSWRRSISPDDDTYHEELLDRSPRLPHTSGTTHRRGDGPLPPLRAPS